ncbi:plastidial pyruvate kinase 1 [Pyrus ussuriensis x Pyrus communis]|uniref:Plastidial pyruvate kinase 1 n=1 Tax=Pyrus ussuriensis x Pyrus communis TaxID=2448454 RepID=A0A5N5FWT1_9ROSA|nr:plastidial pyruvate kinase 1 [Pyrus ussuriensis x Pyrus communis]
MSSSDHRSDEYLSPLYCQGGSSGKVGYFKATHVKINSEELFRDFLEAYKHAIPSGVRVKRVKDDSGHEPCGDGASARKRAIKFHPYYFVLGFTFPMRRLFQEVIYSMKYAFAQCSPNAVRVMLGFSNLSNKGDHEWVRDILEVSREWESDSSPELHWCWLLNFLSRENGGLPPKEKINRIKDEVLAFPIVAVDLVAIEGGKKRSSSLACEPSAKKKPMTSSAARGRSSAVEKLVIDPTSPKGVKMIIEPEPKKLATLKFVSKHPLGAKFGFAFERLTTMKSGKVDSTAKVASGPALLFVTNSYVEKRKSARTGSCEISTESEVREFPKVYALLEADLLENIDACAKFVYSVGKVVVHSDVFTKCSAYSRRFSMIATMHKTLILAAESMREVEVALVAQLHSAAENIEKLKSELAVLKGSDVSAPTSLQLEIAHQKVAHLNVRLSTTQAMLEDTEKEVSRVSLVVEDLERVNSELRSSCFAKDDELIFMHAELQDAHIGLVEENVQLKNEKAGHEVALASCQADFYKLGYIDHLQGRPSDYEFFDKDFETFSISPVDLLDFSFEVAFSGAIKAAGKGTAVECVAVKEPVVAVNYFNEAVDPTLSLRF